MSKVLNLTVTREWFDKIYNGEKPFDYRVVKDYWVKRLVGRDYDYVVIRNGYGKDKPVIVSKYVGHKCGFMDNDLGITSETVFAIGVDQHVYKSYSPLDDDKFALVRSVHNGKVEWFVFGSYVQCLRLCDSKSFIVSKLYRHSVNWLNESPFLQKG